MELPKRFDLIEFETPIAYTDGTEIYKKLAETYKTHDTGYYILAPSGAGKTYFVDSQKEKDWLDGDVLWMSARAHPEGEWWLRDLQEQIEVERRSDIITRQAKKLGFWIIGVDNYDLVPDAIVLPHWTTHKRYIKNREENNYDGGATTANFQQVLNSRKWISRHLRSGVPRFKSVAEAAAFLAAK